MRRMGKKALAAARRAVGLHLPNQVQRHMDALTADHERALLAEEALTIRANELEQEAVKAWAVVRNS